MDNEKENIIDACRDEIIAIDREIFQLVKRRERVSAKIGRAKRDLAIPDRDFKREKVVFDHAISLAKEFDLPTNFVVKLQKIIIETSLSRQEKDRIKHSFNHGTKSVLIIGGAGRLGRWLGRFFADSGHKITVVDLVHPGFFCDYQAHLDETAGQHDIIVVATPIRVSIDILEQLSTIDLKKPVIFDVSSVKAPVHAALLKLKDKGAKVTSLHPMFGPSVELLFGKHVIRTSLGVSLADDLVNDLFFPTSLRVVDMSIDEHDEVISILLSLPHLINIAFVRALTKGNFQVDVLERFSSPTFSNLLNIAKKVLSENPHLYFEIQALNKHTQKIHHQFSEALSEVMKAVHTDNEDEFVQIMADGKQFLLDSPTSMGIKP